MRRGGSSWSRCSRSGSLERRGALLGEGLETLAGVGRLEELADQLTLQCQAIGKRHLQALVDRSFDVRMRQPRTAGELLGDAADLVLSLVGREHTADQAQLQRLVDGD